MMNFGELGVRAVKRGELDVSARSHVFTCKAHVFISSRLAVQSTCFHHPHGKRPGRHKPKYAGLYIKIYFFTVFRLMSSFQKYGLMMKMCEGVRMV
jgi:hypothetical protein